MRKSKIVAVPPEIRVRVQARAEQCIELAEQHFGRKYNPVNISYSVRGMTAGTYLVGTRDVNFNSILLMENVDDFIRRTVAHEVAHYVNHMNGNDAASADEFQYFFHTGRRSKRDVHGPKWKAIMQLFGAPTSRTHSYDVSNSTVKTKRQYRVVCSGCGKEHMVTSAVFNRIRNGVKYTLRGGVHSLHGQLIIPNNTAITPANPTVIPRLPKVAAEPSSTSKLDKCKELYKKYCGISRGEMIAEFVRQAQCTPAGAATYYATCKKFYG